MKSISTENAEMIAIEALQYVAGDEEQLSRFVALSGLSPDQMRDQAGSTGFLVGILDYLLGDEPTLLAFAADRNLDPQTIAAARHVLEPTHDQYSSI